MVVVEYELLDVGDAATSEVYGVQIVICQVEYLQVCKAGLVKPLHQFDDVFAEIEHR